MFVCIVQDLITSAADCYSLRHFFCSQRFLCFLQENPRNVFQPDKKGGLKQLLTCSVSSVMFNSFDRMDYRPNRLLCPVWILQAKILQAAISLGIFPIQGSYLHFLHLRITGGFYNSFHGLKYWIDRKKGHLGFS